MSEEFDIDLNRVKCPYCNEINTDVWECLNSHSDDSEVECEHCGKTFIIRKNVSFDVYKSD
jgi:uncharacterized Zn-finger protein